jgi:magnesium-transporting ATPase (P-type)
MKKPPRDPNAPLLPPRPVVFSAISGFLLTIAVIYFYIERLTEGVLYARSAGLAVLILGCLLLVWSERAVEKPWFSMPIPRTARFWIVWFFVAVSLPVILEVQALNSIFQVAPLRLKDWGIALGLAVAAIGWRAFGWPSKKAE